MDRWYIKGLLTGVVFTLVLLGTSCRKDFDYAPSTGNLSFSKDTVFLDTIFTNIGSATYTLKVYNRGISDVLIPYIGLETGPSSSYRLNVDGLPGKEFTDIPLLAKDSLFVFIETTFDVAPTNQSEFLYTEGLLFGNGDHTQRVELVTLVKDAVFLYPATLSNGTKETLTLGLDPEGNEIRVEGFYLESGQLDFTNEKPYVVYGYAAVPDGSALSMQAGTRVHFHNNSGLIVEDGASLQVNGALSEDQDLLENEVIFEGDRLEPGYADEPGQWGTVWFREGSVGNNLEFLTLKNATVGLRVDGDPLSGSPTLDLANTQIYNSLSHNLWATSARITAENSVLGGAGGYSFLGQLGGSYRFAHCTLANYWGNGFRTGTALALDNFDQNTTVSLEQADFINCIIGGNMAVELVLLQDETETFEFSFRNCLLQFNDTDNSHAGNPLFNFEDTNRYIDVIFDKDSDFFLPFENQFQIGPNSFARDAADPNVAPPLSLDIRGVDRSQNPDIGAYEFVPGN
ncbi:choice-of-anchor Q domain-containing protein [Flagellimonas myxillae]|uniref:choice-of-anchor Q domain-containing protein n=1 Tax=Flagellimonas myxillae TaxID=2942214 RepID=UPI00201EE5C5|nr:choice-of-anchor Q domain-containing protein [Muricauda myxillae]MCL6265706.1 hypothetical protein [Muricauda myxillae]